MRVMMLLLLFAVPLRAEDAIKAIHECATGSASVTFTDANGNAVNPTWATRKVTASEDGTILVSATTATSPGTMWNFKTPPSAACRTTAARPGSDMIRYLSVIWGYGDNEIGQHEWQYKVHVNWFAPPPTPGP